MSEARCRAFAAAPPAMRSAARAFETRFGVRFSTLTAFAADEMAAMHTRDGDERTLMDQVIVASEENPALLRQFDTLTRLANEETPSAADRRLYFEILRSVYRGLESALPAVQKRLIVAPEREGRILAESLGWLDPRRDLAPHAKRIPYEHGLLVGVSECARPHGARHLVIVDGAIASGATIIALLGLLARPGIPVEIFSVHAAREGLRAILRSAAASDLTLRVHVGHVTDGLSPKFYAVAPDGGQVAVGDLGDMIDAVAVAPEGA